MTLPLHLIDAFASAPFTGNPAGVCLLDAARPDAWLQAVAMELNQAETAFLLREGDGFRLRWFTPVAEVALCGHATLASGHFLWSEGILPAQETARFATQSGLLTATQRDGWITLDFPATPPASARQPAGLLEALGLTGGEVLKSRFDWLVVCDDPALVRSLRPDFARLGAIPSRGVIVSAPSDRPDADFISRFFAPSMGVNEDPVTGSAHCALAPYWAKRLGRHELTGYQASPRGGMVRVGNAGERVQLTGKAITVLSGTLEEPSGR